MSNGKPNLLQSGVDSGDGCKDVSGRSSVSGQMIRGRQVVEGGQAIRGGQRWLVREGRRRRRKREITRTPLNWA